MDMLKKELAPLTSNVWAEIENRAAEILRARLSARKVVRVNGPMGWQYTAVPEGRLDLVDDSGDVKSGVYRTKPLTEARVRFSLNKWEMDNINRGAKDIDFSALDSAVEKLADFEEHSIYSGFAKGGIKGLAEAASHKSVTFGADGPSIMAAVSQAMVTLNASHAQGPYTLVVGTKAWTTLNKEIQGIPLAERIERLIGGKVIHSLAVEGAFLLPQDNENLELTIGQDFALGYESHDTREVTLYITESFTFRVLDPALIIRFTL
jgi:uncharacterized linocin/CFP29 family protein